jgi:hypothetical protein
MLLSALLGGVVTWLLLRDDPTMFGPTARVSVRGATNGDYLCAIVAGLCTAPALLLWRKALRQRGLWGNW